MISHNSTKTLHTHNQADNDALNLELAAILENLNPPQHYDILADRLGHFLQRDDLPAPSLARSLAAYFELFALGYSEWQTCYDYHRIHEFFYGAYLQAVLGGGHELSYEVGKTLHQLTEAMIAYTLCENAIICNDPKSLSLFAASAERAGQEAVKFLESSLLEPDLRKHIQAYLLTSTCYFSGLRNCAAIYLAAMRGEDVLSTWHQDIQKALAYLETNSWEWFTELRAHYIFARRRAELCAQKDSELRVKKAELFLRAISYAGDDLIAGLIGYCTNPNKSTSDLLKSLSTGMKLPIKSVRITHLMDIFETSVGEKYLEELVLELPTDKEALHFHVLDGDRDIHYSFDTLQIRVTRLGTISVEFGLSIEDATVSHIRVLESLIGPHAGRLHFTWRDAPEGTGQETVDFVDYFFKCKEWLEHIQGLTAGREYPELAVMRSKLDSWKAHLDDLTGLLPRQFLESGEARSNTTKSLEEKRQSLYNDFVDFRGLAQNCLRDASMAAQLDGFQLTRYFAGPHFARLMDIAEIVLRNVRDFLYTNLVKDTYGFFAFSEDAHIIPDSTVQRLFSFDPSTGWQTILSCGQLAIVGRAGEEYDDGIGLDTRRLTSHPEFKGLVIQNREARASLDDWQFVETPQYRNLATIRSHVTDAVYVGENRAFLYLSDEPYYLVAQYIESVRLFGDIRALVLSFNSSAKKQIEELESFLMQPQHLALGGGNGNSQVALRATRDKLLLYRNEIELFRMSAVRILDLLRSSTISKYQDHSDLLQAITQDSSLNTFQESLERKIEILDRFHAFLTGVLQRRFEEISQAHQRMIGWLLFVLNALAGISAVAELEPYLQHALNGMVTTDVIVGVVSIVLVVIALASISIGVITWQRGRNL